VFESEFSGRGAAEASHRRGQKALFAEVHVNFFIKAKDIIGRITTDQQMEPR
jgi:hypothetical protein